MILTNFPTIIIIYNTQRKLKQGLGSLLKREVLLGKEPVAISRPIKSLIGKDIVHFGRGFTELDDKMDGIYGYRYYLCLENCSSPYYCIEKLIDAI